MSSNLISGTNFFYCRRMKDRPRYYQIKKRKRAENKRILFEKRRKGFTLEEIAEGVIFPTYRTPSEKKEWLEEMHKAIKEYRNANSNGTDR
jgi:hypothetical protein